MLTATLRAVGGSVMVAIPKPILEGLSLAANEKVALRVDAGRLVIEKRSRPRYTLDELLAACEPDADQDAVERDWDDTAPVGREVI